MSGEDNVLLNLAVEVPFLCLSALTVVLTIYLDLSRGTKKGLFSLDTLQQSKAWLYVLYVVAVIVTFLRLWMRNMEGGSPIPADFITVIYNWATTLMIAVSSIVPFRLARSIFTVSRVETKALKTVLLLVVVWVLLLVVSIVVYVVTAEAGRAALLTAWRVFFMLCAVIEMAMLVFIVVNLRRKQLKTTRTLTAFVLTTIGMRLGIVVTLIMKFSTGAIDTFALKTTHMTLVIGGLLCYCYAIFNREQERERRSSQLSTSYNTSRKGSRKASANSSSSTVVISGSTSESGAESGESQVLKDIEEEGGSGENTTKYVTSTPE